jgi:hypothetical protein
MDKGPFWILFSAEYFASWIECPRWLSWRTERSTTGGKQHERTPHYPEEVSLGRQLVEDSSSKQELGNREQLIKGLEMFSQEKVLVVCSFWR